MSAPTRNSRSGRAYLDLQNKARREHRPTEELLQLYALEGEGFLVRLAHSRHAAKFVLKGGVLLAAFGTRRPTRDIDFAAHDLAGDVETLLRMVREVAAVNLDDGLVLDGEGATAQTIRDEDEYSGVRVSLIGTLARARLRFHVDVNVGDPIWPAPGEVSVPRLLDGPAITLPGYPLPMVHAEKVVTAVQRGAANTRWRDFGDVWTLCDTHPVSGADLMAAIRKVAEHRSATLLPLAEALDGFAELGQGRYGLWRRKQRMTHLPEQFSDLLDAVIAFADPALTGQVADQVWAPSTRAWR